MRLRYYLLLCSSHVLATLHKHHHHARGRDEHNQMEKRSQYDLPQPYLPDFAQRNLNTIRRIYDLTVYPANYNIVKKGSSEVPPGLFSNTTVGRVSPVGEFEGFDDSIEYFFALAPVPSDPEFQGVAIYQADVVEFTSGCPNVAASVVYLRTGKVDPTTGAVDSTVPVSTLSQVSTRSCHRKEG